MRKVGLDIDYQVDFCITGLEAIELLKETYDSGLTYKLILTDFNMPVCDGIKATSMIRDHLTHQLSIKREDQPLIIGVTGHVLDKFKNEGLKAGMDRILEKPCYFT